MKWEKLKRFLSALVCFLALSWLCFSQPIREEPGIVVMTEEEFNAISTALENANVLLVTLEPKLIELEKSLTILKNETIKTQDERDLWRNIAIGSTLGAFAIGLILGLMN